MTLHGGSGTNDADFKQAIKAGVTIVHINTKICLARWCSMEAALAADPGVVTCKLLVQVVAAIQKVVPRA